MTDRKAITAEKVRQLLDYCPETGVFVWNPRQNTPVSWNTKYAGKVAGSPRGTGGWVYTVIKINRQGYLAHILAWLLMTGAWPKLSIDHINRNGLDNRWANLREATVAQQAQNRRRNSKLPKGVRRLRNRYIAVLGSFETPEEAHAIWLRLAPEIHGEFFHLS